MGTLLFIRLFIVICFVGVIVAISAIEKRDVHHKIIVKTGRKPRSSPHHSHHHHNSRKNREKNKHHHHHRHQDASLEDDLLYSSRENSFEDTSKYQSHRHKSKSRPHHLKHQEPPFQIEFTPLVSTESEDLRNDQRNHYKPPSNKHKKRHNHRNHYGEILKPPQIELTTAYPTPLPFLSYFETTDFPSFDRFNSFNQKIIDLNQSPLINPDSFIIKPKVNDVFINNKNQSFDILTPTFKMEKLVADETVTEKLIAKVEEPLTTTTRPSIRSRGKVRTRKNPN